MLVPPYHPRFPWYGSPPGFLLLLGLGGKVLEMKIVYSVPPCRMRSWYLTSAHDGHFPLLDCCYLRALESSWRAWDLHHPSSQR